MFVCSKDDNNDSRNVKVVTLAVAVTIITKTVIIMNKAATEQWKGAEIWTKYSIPEPSDLFKTNSYISSSEQSQGTRPE